MNSEEVLLFKTIFEQTPVSTQIFSPSGDTVMVNQAWEKLWKAPFSLVKSYNILKDKQLVETGTMPYIKKAFKGEVVTLPEIKYDPSLTVNIPGVVPYRWLSAKMYPIKNNIGEVTHVVLQHEDVTEKRESEEGRNRLAAIVESTQDAVISINNDGIITSWNKAAQQMYGYKATEAIGNSIYILIPDNLVKEEEQLLKSVREGKKLNIYETIRVKKNGEHILISLSISPIKDGHGKVIGASKIARDITAQKVYEKSIKESEERLRVALNAGQIGVWDWDINLNELKWTDKVYEIHDVDQKKFNVTYDTFKELIHPDDRDYTKKKITEALSGNEDFSAEFRIITPKGKVKWVATKAVITYDPTNKPQRMLGATLDITQQKQLEQDKSDFLSMASHELKTPLTSLKMFIDLLFRELDNGDQEKKKYFAKRIMDQASRLTELTNDLLDVSRIETGKLSLNIEKFSINELIEDTVEGIQATTKKHKIIIKNSDKVEVNADRYRIYQVLVNLLTNAVKYSPNGKLITIEIKKDESNVVVSVKDNGRGIAKEQHKRIFERLYQVTDPEEKTFPGLGLGLFISKEIVARHNGSIWLKSAKGKGATFYFSLPLT